MVPLLVVLGVIVVLFFVVGGVYNGLVRAKNAVENAWSQIDVQLKRRHDLIPNLVETVKGFASHEKGVFEAVTEARASAMKAGGRGDKIQAESALGGALANVLAVAENYPELKSNENFKSLQEELTSTENRIGFSRQAYNDSVMTYDNKRETFPNNIIAGMFNFKEEPYWKIENSAERQAPQVSFS